MFVPVAFTLDDARRYVADIRWRFARTMPQWPHEYTVWAWRPDLAAHFLAFADMVGTHGIGKPWPSGSATPHSHNTYLALGGWEYGTMNGPISETVVINRARLAPPTARSVSDATAVETARASRPTTMPRLSKKRTLAATSESRVTPGQRPLIRSVWCVGTIVRLGEEQPVVRSAPTPVVGSGTWSGARP